MKKFIPFLLSTALLSSAFGQQTETVESDASLKSDPAWSEINARPVPQWWQDGKFGIFIHWGLYSVPAFSQVGQYSEWYWKTLLDPSRVDHADTKAFHEKNYGKSFTYQDFEPMFTAEFFNPDDWAKLFQDAGAKYVVLTSKHHEGYCLWKSQEANDSWGRLWNSVEGTPQRDIVGELTNAVRKTDVKMGLYFSIYEWYNPLYTAKPDLFVDKVLVPQFKDLVKTYKPSILFVDGEWDHPAETWRSTEVLNWLFKESPVKDEVVINDRWGKGGRHKNGGYYTTEYGAGLPNADKPWEENRGMAYSFGYSRTEKLKDYNSSQTLIYMLVDIVSRGGNFLLDIGPTADGRIPPIMEERLTDIGAWLKVNGEAIYGTKMWTKSCQWGEGKELEQEHGEYKVKYDVMKFTVNPDPGFAVKQCFFTQKDDALYAIMPSLPDNDMITLKGVKTTEGASVTLLGHEGKVEFTQEGDNLNIKLPKLNASKLPCNYAWTLKISKVSK